MSISPSRENGASAIIIAASLILLMGMAAVAIDLGAGFNERRQDQTAADLAAVAAATNGASEVNAVQAALTFARSNLQTTYSDSEWQTLWQSCTDPDMPAGFSPVDDPWSTNTADKLACMSAGVGKSGEAEIRVRVPDQETETTFGRVLGVDVLTTRAEAHAGFWFTVKGSALPFGILYGTPTGAEQCVVQPAGGHAVGACDGPYSGNFGGVELPLWGSEKKGTTPDCSPGGFELSVNIAIGSDHIIAPAFGTSDLNGDGDIDADDYPGSGGTHPGDAPITSNGSPEGQASKLDACSLSGGEAVPTDAVPAIPINTVNVDTGFAGSDVKLGLIGDTTDPAFPNGALPRLRQVAGSPHTLFVDEKDGSSTKTYEVDNTPLWEYLRSPSDLGGLGTLSGSGAVCNKNHLDTLSWDLARADFMTCLSAYVMLSNPPPLFTDALADNPRFAWAPVFQYTDWGSGNGWQPIHSFTALYLDGIWFNCNGNGNGTTTNEDCGGKKGLEWYPGELPDGSTQTGKNGGGALNLRLDQMTAITLPTYALPESIAGDYPGKVKGPFTTGLLR